MKKLLSVFLAAILLVGCSAPKETASYRQISMEKFIPYEKLSKKEKRKMDLAKRQTWGITPTTITDQSVSDGKIILKNTARTLIIIAMKPKTLSNI